MVGTRRAASVVAARRLYLARQLSWRAFVVRQNFSNCRRKVIDAGTRHDDAVAAAMSFFSDAQESPALVFSELHVEMLALNLQFSRLDDVIHFPLKPPTLTHPFWRMEEKSAEFVQILWAAEAAGRPCAGQSRAGPFDRGQTDTTTPWGCGAGCSIYNLVRPAT
jgi:hypothetical protein